MDVYRAWCVSIPSRTGNGLQGAKNRVAEEGASRFNPLQNGERPARTGAGLDASPSSRGFNPLQNGERPAGLIAIFPGGVGRGSFNPLQNGERPAGTAPTTTSSARPGSFNPLQNGERPAGRGMTSLSSRGGPVSIPSRTGNGLQAAWFAPRARNIEAFQSPPERGTACRLTAP